jgi:hypothetical protein
MTSKMLRSVKVTGGEEVQIVMNPAARHGNPFSDADSRGGPRYGAPAS